MKIEKVLCERRRTPDHLTETGNVEYARSFFCTDDWKNIVLAKLKMSKVNNIVHISV